MQSELVELKRRIWESDAEAQQQCVQALRFFSGGHRADVLVRRLAKVAELNAAVQSAEARVKDATDAADASKQSVAPLMRECERLTALLRERDGSDAVRHLHEWQVPPHLAISNGGHGAWGAHPHPAGQMPWPGPPPLLAPPPLPLPLHGHHEPPFIPTPVTFGDFSAFIPPPPGFLPGQARAAVPGVASPAPPAQTPAESAPPPMDESMLVSIFSRAAPAVADPTVTPDVLLARVEDNFLRPHSWVPHYSNRYGSVRDFILAHPEEFVVTGDGHVFRRPQTPPVQMMITPLPPPVQGILTGRNAKPVATEADVTDEAGALPAAEPRRGQNSNRGRAGGQSGGRGRKSGGGRGGGRPTEF